MVTWSVDLVWALEGLLGESESERGMERVGEGEGGDWR